MLRARGPVLGLLLFLCLGAFSIREISTEPPANQSNLGHVDSRSAAKDDAFSRFWKWSTADPVAFYTFVLAVFTGALVVISSIQIWFLVRADETARISANSAKQSVQIAERALIDLEGPFLYPVIEDDDIRTSTNALQRYLHDTTDPERVEPIRPVISFKIKNYGRTPALLQIITAAFFHGQPQDYHNDLLGGFATEMMIEPKELSAEPINRRMINGIEREEWKSITAGTSRIYLRGGIIFYDIFGNRYEQKFCLAWRNRYPFRFVAWGTDSNRRRRLSS